MNWLPNWNENNVTMPKIQIIVIGFIFSTNFKGEQPPGHVFGRLPKILPIGHVELTLHCCVHTEHHTMASYSGFTHNINTTKCQSE